MPLSSTPKLVIDLIERANDGRFCATLKREGERHSLALVFGADLVQAEKRAESLTKSVNAFEPMREALLRLANAADRVGMRHFDTDDNSPEVEEMSEATLNARAALKLAGDATC